MWKGSARIFRNRIGFAEDVVGEFLTPTSFTP